ncbi:DsbA family oxidoreductase [Agrilutibacter solisilvae]|uniref:DsbA family oxidoreductase n=1 Tax=Agrilutibacter solisilvae TaxID=2763317 RepID=A0A974Y445_9GAMM|nr:DsbA family oxidoreductase [Lysobacter solisilvae]QSX77521.1 DsbA family oxidoreductase [Lysobacter solisilvae]
MSGANGLTVAVHFDLICPWCFIGKRQLELARERFGQKYPEVTLETTWHPVQLLPGVPEQGLPFAEFYERRLGSPEAVAQRRRQIMQAARAVDLPLELAAIGRLPNTSRAHQLLRRVAAHDKPLYEDVLERLFVAYFQQGQDIGDARTLQALAMEVGVPMDRPGAAPGDEAGPLHGSTVPGVPHFVFNDRLSLAGAQDASLLLLAMRKAAQGTAPAERA